MAAVATSPVAATKVGTPVGAKKVGAPAPTPVAAKPATPVVATPTPTPAAATAVGGATPAPAPAPAVAVGAPAAKKGPVGMVRSDFDLSTAVDADGKAIVQVTGEGDAAVTTLTGVPANWNMNKHKSLVEENFADEATFLDFKAAVADQWAKRYIDSAAKYREEAKVSRQFGDSDTRKKADKLNKMRREYLALQAELAGEGYEAAPLPDAVEATPAAE